MYWNTSKLDDGPAPLWWQIAERLRGGIESGQFKTGHLLPSEAELNRLFGVSRTTARAALDKLRHEGLITRQSGKGSIVIAPHVEQPLSRLSGFAQDMAERGLQASYDTRSVGLTTAPKAACDALNTPPDAQLLTITRRLLADGTPMGYSQSWLAPTALRGQHPPTSEELDDQSFYAWLAQQCGQQVRGRSESIEAAIADVTLAKELVIERGAAVLVARRLSVNEKDEPIEYVVVAYRADRYRFTIDLRSQR